MGQYFNIVNVDKRQIIGMSKWGESTDDCGVSNLITVRRVVSLEDLLKKYKEFSASRKIGEHDLGALSKIPSEIISLFFEALPSPESIIMFSLTNSQLFAIGYPTVSQVLVELNSPWKYGRIICVGDYSEDLPEGCITEDEAHMLLEGSDPDEQTAYDRDGTFNLYNATRNTFTNRYKLNSWPWDKNRRLSRDDTFLCYQLTSWIHPFEPIKSKVLINVSKKEYIRETGEVKFPTTIPPLIVWGYDDVEGERGPWAGDRLAIVSSDDFELRMKEEEGQWTDFTGEGERLQAQFLQMFA